MPRMFLYLLLTASVVSCRRLAFTSHLGQTPSVSDKIDDVSSKLEHGTKTRPSSQLASSTTTTEFPTIEADALSDTEIIKQLLGKGYDWRVRPPGIDLKRNGTHGPVIVRINMLIRSISKIDDVNMEYSVQMTFRESWVDGRLAYGYPGDDTPNFIILTYGQQIWMPDSFFQNEKQANKHMIDKPNILIRIYKNGAILYSVRISLVLSCPMHLQYYPMDVQTCLIDLASYAYTDSDIEYRWQETDPIQLKDGLHSSLPSFQLNNVTTGYCTSRTNTGTYSCLRTVLELKRQFSYYLLQLYIPSTMLVIVSWVSFWLDRTAVPARVTLGVTTLLTMTTQASGINAKLPPVSYTKAIDVWIGACLTFIFGALLEFAWVTYISTRSYYKWRVGKASRAERGSLLIENAHATLTTGRADSVSFHDDHRPAPIIAENQVWIRQNDNGGPETAELLAVGSNRLSKTNKYWRLVRRCKLIQWIQRRMEYADNAKRADLVSRVMFPVFFIFFNCLYWLSYSDYNLKLPSLQ